MSARRAGLAAECREVGFRPGAGGPRGAKERLWYVTAAPGQQKPDDPQFYFGEAVLGAFEAHRLRRGDPVAIAGARPAP